MYLTLCEMHFLSVMPDSTCGIFIYKNIFNWSNGYDENNEQGLLDILWIVVKVFVLTILQIWVLTPCFAGTGLGCQILYPYLFFG